MKIRLTLSKAIVALGVIVACGFSAIVVTGMYSLNAVKWHGEDRLNIQFTASPARQQEYRNWLHDHVGGSRAA